MISSHFFPSALYVCMYVCIYVCMYVCMYVYAEVEIEEVLAVQVFLCAANLSDHRTCLLNYTHPQRLIGQVEMKHAMDAVVIKEGMKRTTMGGAV